MSDMDRSNDAGASEDGSSKGRSWGPTTHVSQLLQVDKQYFAETYQDPIRGLFSCLCKDPAKAEDLTQAFLADKGLPQEAPIDNYDPRKGGFRPYLKTLIRNYWRDWLNAEQQGVQLVSVPQGPDGKSLAWPAKPQDDYEDESSQVVEDRQDILWALDLLKKAKRMLKEWSDVQKEKGLHWDVYCAKTQNPNKSWSKISECLAGDYEEKKLRNRFEVAKGKMREFIRQLVSTQNPPGLIEAEVRYFIKCISAWQARRRLGPQDERDRLEEELPALSEANLDEALSVLSMAIGLGSVLTELADAGEAHLIQTVQGLMEKHDLDSETAGPLLGVAGSTLGCWLETQGPLDANTKMKLAGLCIGLQLVDDPMVPDVTEWAKMALLAVRENTNIPLPEELNSPAGLVLRACGPAGLMAAVMHAALEHDEAAFSELAE